MNKLTPSDIVEAYFTSLLGAAENEPSFEKLLNVLLDSGEYFKVPKDLYLLSTAIPDFLAVLEGIREKAGFNDAQQTELTSLIQRQLSELRTMRTEALIWRIKTAKEEARPWRITRWLIDEVPTTGTQDAAVHVVVMFASQKFRKEYETRAQSLLSASNQDYLEWWTDDNMVTGWVERAALHNTPLSDASENTVLVQIALGPWDGDEGDPRDLIEPEGATWIDFTRQARTLTTSIYREVLRDESDLTNEEE